MRKIGVEHLQAGTSGWLHSRCPLAPWTHRTGHDRRPSFAVKPQHDGVSAYMCWACHRHGRVSSLIKLMHYLGADVGEVVGEYPNLAKEADAADMMVVIAVDYDERMVIENTLPDPLDTALFDGVYMPAVEVPPARSYLVSRGVTFDAAMSLDLGWDPDQRRIMFPVRDGHGDLYGYTGRAVDPGVEPKVRDYHGLPKRHLILGEDRWEPYPKAGRPLVIVEGLFGLAHLVSMGLEKFADVGALLGTAITEQKVKSICDRQAATYLLLDLDEAGDTALFGRVGRDGERDFHTGLISQLMSQVPVFVPTWPEGKDDPDQLTREEIWEMFQTTKRWE